MEALSSPTLYCDDPSPSTWHLDFSSRRNIYSSSRSSSSSSLDKDNASLKRSLSNPAWSLVTTKVKPLRRNKTDATHRHGRSSSVSEIVLKTRRPQWDLTTTSVDDGESFPGQRSTTRRTSHQTRKRSRTTVSPSAYRKPRFPITNENEGIVEDRSSVSYPSPSPAIPDSGYSSGSSTGGASVEGEIDSEARVRDGDGDGDGDNAFSWDNVEFEGGREKEMDGSGDEHPRFSSIFWTKRFPGRAKRKWVMGDRFLDGTKEGLGSGSCQPPPVVASSSRSPGLALPFNLLDEITSKHLSPSSSPSSSRLILPRQDSSPCSTSIRQRHRFSGESSLQSTNPSVARSPIIQSRLKVLQAIELSRATSKTFTTKTNISLVPSVASVASAATISLLPLVLACLPSQSSFRPVPMSPNHFWRWNMMERNWWNNVLLGWLGLPSTIGNENLGIANWISVIATVAMLFLAVLDRSLRLNATRNLMHRNTASHILFHIRNIFPSWTALLFVRLGLGHLFGRATGWAMPQLFWTGAGAESSGGLLPLLLVDLIRGHVVQWLDRRGSFTFRSVLAGLALWNCSERMIFWGLSALIVGLAFAVVPVFILTPLRVENAQVNKTTRSHDGRRQKNSWIGVATTSFILCLYFAKQTKDFGSPSDYLGTPTPTASQIVSTLYPEYPYLMTILLMTAPRPGNPDFLIKTLESYLENFPDPDQVESTSRSAAPRLRIVVYTHFLHHPVFDAATSNTTFSFSRRPSLARKVEHYVEWIRQDPLDQADRLDQRLHLARALGLVADSGKNSSAYIMLAEDDFPLCADEDPWGSTDDSDDKVTLETYRNSWRDMMSLIWWTNQLMPDGQENTSVPTAAVGQHQEVQQVPGHCGIFVGTGGSGLIVRNEIAKMLPNVLLGGDDWAAKADMRERVALDSGIDVSSFEQPPDLSIQNCLLGKDVEGICRACAVPSISTTSTPIASARQPFHFLDPADRKGKSGLVTSERLLMKHLGYNASTTPERRYEKGEWGCGWRHPFNGYPEVLTLAL